MRTRPGAAVEGSHGCTDTSGLAEAAPQPEPCSRVSERD